MKIIIYLSCLVVLLIGCLSFKEGFESGQYAYLAPGSPPLLDATTQSNFITTFNNSGGVVLPQIILSDSNKPFKELKAIVTLDEINYYIQNKKWPYNSYISNYLTINKDVVLQNLTKMKIYSLEDLQKVFPTRLVYMGFIDPTEKQISPPPLSNNIFNGKAVAPPEAPEAPVKDETVATIHPPFSSENYAKLQSICSTLR